ncbi:hypothetical protein MASR2M78_25790 [Treponema sp.]
MDLAEKFACVAAITDPPFSGIREGMALTVFVGAEGWYEIVQGNPPKKIRDSPGTGWPFTLL